MKFISALVILFTSIAGFAVENSKFWGYHLLLDCKDCNVEKVTDPENILAFIHTIVPEIGMRAYGDPVLEHFATHDPMLAGYSLIQLIETSSITAHFVDWNGDAYIDIFSCKPFNIDEAKEIVERFFHPSQMKTTYVSRQA
jgi:S-adenosylmethionine/arginine decarboxylase-like enzyme